MTEQQRRQIEDVYDDIFKEESFTDLNQTQVILSEQPILTKAHRTARDCHESPLDAYKMPRNVVPVEIGRIRFSHLFDQCRHDNIISQGKSRALPVTRKKMNRTLTLSQLLEGP